MNSAWMYRRTALLVVLGMSLIGGSVGSQSPSERLVSITATTTFDGDGEAGPAAMSSQGTTGLE